MLFCNKVLPSLKGYVFLLMMRSTRKKGPYPYISRKILNRLKFSMRIVFFLEKKELNRLQYND